ncbi:MAG: threonine synthase [Deltaproteobacteria bacterium]|nr:threonine synthase [Deltaproteobacteria bacterium]
MNECPWKLACVDCSAEYSGLAVRFRCDCGATLDVVHDLNLLKDGLTLNTFDRRLASKQIWDRSGVWRFSELVLPLDPKEMVTKPEGNTNLYASARLAEYTGIESLLLKHEGENPTASFKDRGMTVGVSMAKKLGMQSVACASTGNTSASMAAYSAQAGLRALVFIPEGKIAYGKLSQALAYGAKTIQIAGDFDIAMQLVEQVCADQGIYLLNSINPFRIEGQKAIGFELLQDLSWEVPDWIVLPGGNLGNSSAISKGLGELETLGLIKKLPRMAVIQAAGANPLYTAFSTDKDLVPVQNADTIATAIKIGNPVSWRKSLRGIAATNGLVEQVSDQEIMDAKAQVDAAGIGAEPASCATVAGAKKLVERGVIKKDEKVCGILTGHLLKDPDAVVGYHKGTLDNIESNFQNAPISVPAELEAVLKAISD